MPGQWATVLVLLATVPAQRPLEPAARVCDAHPRTANLAFTLHDVHGDDVSLSTYRNKVILLDFWATWCAPCKSQIPVFIEMQAKYEREGFVVLGVSVNDPVVRLKPFVEQLGMNYPVLIGAGRHDVFDAYGPMAAFPTAFLIARDGRICSTHTGPIPRGDLEQRIRRLLEEPVTR